MAHFLPISADVEKLHKYLKDTMSKAINYSPRKFDKDLYYKLSKSLLVQIMVFNRRRPGKMSKISLISYLNRT